MNQRPFIIGIAGGSASGKTTLAHELVTNAQPNEACLIQLDSYYRPLDHLTQDERAKINFDEPAAFEISLLEKHLRELHLGHAASVPVYDFSHHNRKHESRSLAPHAIIVVEGILTFCDAALFSLFDYSVFVETPDEVRFSRREARDIKERGRTPESVKWQWNDTVQPMYTTHCAPTKEKARLVISGLEPFDATVVELLKIARVWRY